MKGHVVIYVMWGAACTGSVFAEKSRAVGMSWLPQLIQSSIVVHGLLVQNHCQLINVMFSFPIPWPTFFLYFISLYSPGAISVSSAARFHMLSRNIFLQWERKKKKICFSPKQQLIQISKTHHHLHCTHIIRAICGLYDGGRLSLSTVNCVQ